MCVFGCRVLGEVERSVRTIMGYVVIEHCFPARRE